MSVLDNLSLDELKEKVRDLDKQLRDRGMKKIHISFGPEAENASPEKLLKDTILFLQSYLNGSGKPFKFNDNIKLD